MIDGSLVRVPVQQLTRSEQEQVAAGTVPNWKLAKRRQKDVDARWTKSYYGYKRHVLVSAEAQECVLNFVYGMDNVIDRTGDLESPGLGLKRRKKYD